MIRHHLIKSDIDNSSLFWSDDEFERLQHSYDALEGIKSRIVWVTNYTNNEDFPINVPADDPLHRILPTSINSTELESLLSSGKDDISLLNKINNLDLSKLNLDDLLILLYRLQQQTTQSINTKNSVIASASTISSSSSSSSSSSFNERKSSFRRSSQMPNLHSLSPTLSNAVHSSLSMLNEIPSYQHPICRRQSSFTLSNIADVPKQLTTTLAKPISSYHSQNTKKHIHSPNDVVTKLLQSFNLHNKNIGKNSNKNHQKFIEHKSERYSSFLPNYNYQESQQHKAKVISNLLGSNSNENFPCFVYKNNSNYFYH